MDTTSEMASRVQQHNGFCQSLHPSPGGPREERPRYTFSTASSRARAAANRRTIWDRINQQPSNGTNSGTHGGQERRVEAGNHGEAAAPRKTRGPGFSDEEDKDLVRWLLSTKLGSTTHKAIWKKYKDSNKACNRTIKTLVNRCCDYIVPYVRQLPLAQEKRTQLALVMGASWQAEPKKANESVLPSWFSDIVNEYFPTSTYKNDEDKRQEVVVKEEPNDDNSGVAVSIACTIGRENTRKKEKSQRNERDKKSQKSQHKKKGPALAAPAPGPMTPVSPALPTGAGAGASKEKSNRGKKEGSARAKKTAEKPNEATCQCQKKSDPPKEDAEKPKEPEKPAESVAKVIIETPILLKESRA